MADLSRRRLLQASMLASGAMLLPGVMQAAWAAGSDKPAQDTVRIGFIPLTDCAPVVIAALKGFDKKHGITIVPTKEASWAAVRDKLVAGELDAAHILYGLLYGLELGIAGKPQQMANLMTLNQNGQAITLSSDLTEKGVRDLDGLKKLIAQQAPGIYTFAHTFPTGTSASRGTRGRLTTESGSPLPRRSPSGPITRKRSSAPDATGWRKIRTPHGRW